MTDTTNRSTPAIDAEQRESMRTMDDIKQDEQMGTDTRKQRSIERMIDAAQQQEPTEHHESSEKPESGGQ